MKSWKHALERVRGTLPTEYLSGLPSIRVSGMQDVRVEAHRGLLSYSEERILVKAADRTLCISGTGLILCCITAAEVHVRGSIRNVETVD